MAKKGRGSTPPSPISPYGSRPIALRVGPQRREYYVPRDLLQNPKWIASAASSGESIDLLDVDEHTGHILVHYLHTGAYQSLNHATVDDTRNQFKTAILACIAARSYDLVGLQELAMHKIEHYGANMTIFDVIDEITGDSSILPGNTVWFQDYLAAKAKIAFEQDYMAFSRQDIFKSISDAALSNALANCVMDLYNDKVSRMLQAMQGVPEVVPSPADGGAKDVGDDGKDQAAEPTPHSVADPDPDAGDIKLNNVASDAPQDNIRSSVGGPVNPPDFTFGGLRSWTSGWGTQNTSWSANRKDTLDAREAKDETKESWSSLSLGSAKSQRKEDTALVEETPAAPISSSEDVDWGAFSFTSSKKKKKKKKNSEALPPAEPEPEPVTEAPEPEAVKDVDNWNWGSTTTTTTIKKKNKKGVAFVEEIPDEPEPEPVPLVEPTTKKKKAKKSGLKWTDDVPLDEKLELPPPSPVPEPEAPVESPWGSWPATSKKKKKGKKVEELPLPPPEPEPEPALEVSIPMNAPGCFMEPKVEEPRWELPIDESTVEEPVADEPPPPPPLPDPEPEMPKEEEIAVKAPNGICPDRAKHLLEGDMWRSCESCRAMLCQIAIRLARIRSADSDDFEMVDRVLIA